MNRKSKIIDELLQAVYQKTGTQSNFTHTPAVSRKSLYEEVMSMAGIKISSTVPLFKRYLNESTEDVPTKISDLDFKLIQVEENVTKRTTLTYPIGNTGLVQQLVLDVENYNPDTDTPSLTDDEITFKAYLRKGPADSNKLSADLNTPEILKRGVASELTVKEVEEILQKFNNFIDINSKVEDTTPETPSLTSSTPSDAPTSRGPGRPKKDVSSETDKDSTDNSEITYPKLDGVEVRFVKLEGSDPFTQFTRTNDNGEKRTIRKHISQPTQEEFDKDPIHDHLITANQFETLLKYKGDDPAYQLRSKSTSASKHSIIHLKRYKRTDSKVLSPVDDKISSKYPNKTIPVEVTVGEVMDDGTIRFGGDRSSGRKIFWTLQDLRSYGFGLLKTGQSYFDRAAKIAAEFEKSRQSEAEGGKGISSDLTFTDLYSRLLKFSGSQEASSDPRAAQQLSSHEVIGMLKAVRDSLYDKLTDERPEFIKPRTLNAYLEQLNSLSISPKTVSMVYVALTGILYKITETEQAYYREDNSD